MSGFFADPLRFQAVASTFVTGRHQQPLVSLLLSAAKVIPYTKCERILSSAYTQSETLFFPSRSLSLSLGAFCGGILHYNMSGTEFDLNSFSVCCLQFYSLCDVNLDRILSFAAHKKQPLAKQVENGFASTNAVAFWGGGSAFVPEEPGRRFPPGCKSSE